MFESRCFIIMVVVILMSFAGCEDFYGDVQGVVTDEETGEPIVNAKVLIVSLKDSTMVQSTIPEVYCLQAEKRYARKECRKQHSERSGPFRLNP